MGGMPDDGRERLERAFEALTREGDATTRERLRSVANHLLPLQSCDFRRPSDGALLEQVKSELTAVRDPGQDGDLEMTLGAMSDDQAERIAAMVLELHLRVADA